MSPVVSIIVPFCNAEPYLLEAIRSVEEQSFRDWELVLVNDGSTDGGPPWLEWLRPQMLGSG